MSGYKVVEEGECPIYYNNEHKEIEEYWLLYSPIQRKKFNKVLYQLKETWYSLFNMINTFRNLGAYDVDMSNNLMLKIHKMFIIEHKHKIEYYNEEKLKLRRQKGYIKKKINKLRNSKSKI